jgi:hypothetical protein
MLFEYATESHCPIGFAASCTADSIDALRLSRTARTYDKARLQLLDAVVRAGKSYAQKRSTFQIGVRSKTLSPTVIANLITSIQDKHYSGGVDAIYSPYSLTVNAAIHVGRSIIKALPSHGDNRLTEALGEARIAAESAATAVGLIFLPGRRGMLIDTLNDLYHKYTTLEVADRDSQKLLLEQAKVMSERPMPKDTIQDIISAEASVYATHGRIREQRIIDLEAQLVAAERQLARVLAEAESGCEFLDEAILDSWNHLNAGAFQTKRKEHFLTRRETFRRRLARSKKLTGGMFDTRRIRDRIANRLDQNQIPKEAVSEEVVMLCGLTDLYAHQLCYLADVKDSQSRVARIKQDLIDLKVG